MSAHNNQSTYAAEDMDAFFDFNQADHPFAPSETTSPTSKISPGTIDPQSTFMSHEHADEHQTFAGPSHEYDRFHQQTGLPTGSLSTVSAMNDFGGFSMGMGYNSGLSMDMDFDASPSMPSLYYGNEPDLVDPTSILPEQPVPPMQRLRPGMHSQQAQQAKQEALARQKRQQQTIQQRSNSDATTLRSNRARSQGSADPVVDERISQLLDQMRQHGSAGAEDGSSQDSMDALPSVLRNRKDEDEMDEDERLLASEEGKKLSSKERRQLRNKVSARAFRSRRKEYITQLESELATKAQECNELKIRNRQLEGQNAQLTQLTQTVLRHPAFATFMDDMSNDPSLLSPFQQQRQQQLPSQQQQQQQPQQPSVQHANKDVNPNRAMKMEPQQQDIHVGMTMMPDQHFDFSNLSLDTNANAGWDYQVGTNMYQNTQVFAVFETPAMPNIEEITAKLSGKSSHIDEADDADTDYPAPVKDVSLPYALPTTVEPATSPFVDDSDVADDPDFALYARSSTKPTVSTSAITTAARMLDQSLSGKTPVHFSLQIENSQSEDAQIAEINRLFASERAVIKRVRAITSEYLQ